MISPSQKRKRYGDMRNALVAARYQLSLTSMDSNTKLKETNEDFKSYLKAIIERHSELYAHSTNLHERYR